MKGDSEMVAALAQEFVPVAPIAKAYADNDDAPKTAPVVLTPEQKEKVREIAKSVIDMALYNGKKEDALDNPEFLAYEIIDLTEIKTELDLQRHVAYKVIKSHEWPQGVSGYVARQFDLLNTL